MDGAGKVLEDAPDPIGEVEVERVEIMNFGDGKDWVNAHIYTFSVQFHLTHVLERPVEGEVWFCDDECRTNSGFRSKKCHLA